MPSFWSSVAKHMANSSFSRAMPLSMSICIPRSMQALEYFTAMGALAVKDLKNIHTAAGAEMLTDEMIRGLAEYGDR